MDRKLLKIYLNDHLAGSVVGIAVARRSLANNGGTPLGDFLESFLREVDDDQRWLEQAMRRLRVRRTPWKLAGAAVAERAGRLKLNGRITSYSPLSRVEELEALLIGVEGKRAVLASLRELDDGRLAGLDIDSRIGRAERQQADIERFRLQAVRRALR
jgi:hypothetical protein